jgi:hypothetical protein
MALGTNYVRNLDRELQAVNNRMDRCRALAQELVDETGCCALTALDLASRVILDRMTRDEAFEKARKAAKR